MSDDAIKRMLGLDKREPNVLPEERPPRLDMSRCRVYAVSKAAEAMGLFKGKYHVEPTLCMASNVGGKSVVEAWAVGYVPEGWSEDSA